MGRPQISLAIAQAKGALVTHPQRFEGRIDSQANLELIPIGPISPVLADDPQLVAVWSSYVREVTWLRECDRKLLEIACVLGADMWDMVKRRNEPIEYTPKGKPIGGTNLEVLNTLMRVLSHMGATPTSVGKVFTGAKTGEDDKTKRGANYQRYWNPNDAAAA